MSWEEREVLLVVKTYPVKSKAYGNTVCTAGILEDTNEWIRIYPIRMEVIKKNKLNKYTRRLFSISLSFSCFFAFCKVLRFKSGLISFKR